MLKRRRKLSKNLQIRKKITTFAEDKRHLGKTIKRACCVALDLHYLCIVNENGSAHRDSDTRVRQNFLWRAVSLRRFATQCVTINNS